MAAMFFQGSLGSALTYSVFQGSGARPGPQGQPPGSWGGQGRIPTQASGVNHESNASGGGFTGGGGFSGSRVSGNQSPQYTDAIKSGPGTQRT
ncbi:hypothetical protein ALP97_200059 [Pseudomonas salomonii]|jgi:type IV secretion system protein VirB6|uniref:Uncharacterized protein n=1 Tax=Pseudomonas salomonii TaxID=191391 RepID=A0A3M4QCW0_9PSED|nr:hypothetical protein ALP97_200059 [Pseudomonas salomonii]